MSANAFAENQEMATRYRRIYCSKPQRVQGKRFTVLFALLKLSHELMIDLIAFALCLAHLNNPLTKAVKTS